MTSQDYWKEGNCEPFEDSERAELLAERSWERRRMAQRLRHPDQRDPDYIEWPEENTEEGGER